MPAAQLNILDLLVFVGALWGALVFPVIASFYWEKVTNKAFTISVLVALACFLPVRFGWISHGRTRRNCGGRARPLSASVWSWA